MRKFKLSTVAVLMAGLTIPNVAYAEVTLSQLETVAASVGADLSSVPGLSGLIAEVNRACIGTQADANACLIAIQALGNALVEADVEFTAVTGLMTSVRDQIADDPNGLSVAVLNSMFGAYNVEPRAVVDDEVIVDDGGDDGASPS